MTLANFLEGLGVLTGNCGLDFDMIYIMVCALLVKCVTSCASGITCCHK